MSEDFIEDDFNLTGLNTMVPFWKEAMEMVLDIEAGPHIMTRSAALLMTPFNIQMKTPRKSQMFQ